MSAIHQVLLAGGGGYQITNSLRFRASNSAYLSKTFGSPTSSTVWTFSAWCKRGTLGSTSYLLGASTTTNFGFNSSNQLVLTLNGTTACTSTAVFRDPSAWMHIVYQQNGSAQTIYVNNASVATGTTAAAIFNTAIAHQVGAANTTNFFDGHLANVYWIDGQALTPSSFGQTDATTGVWVPKAYSGTFGTNGFFLQFKDAASTTTIGYDTSGNSNNFTTSGISVTSGATFDQSLDTPTLNYSVMNPLDLSGTAATFQWANLQVTRSGASLAQAYSSIWPSSGKWYCEMTAGADVANLSPGIITGSVNAGANRYLGQDAFTYAYDVGGQKVNNGSYTAYGNSWTAGDVIGIIIDADNGKLYFSKNGTVQNSGDPVAGTNAAFTSLTGPFRVAVHVENGGLGDFNFGQRAFSYTPPSGFKALNTANLSVPSIKKPSLYMDATLRTGTGATASVSSLGFQPDLVWIKSRSAATDHGLYDAVRGVQKQLESNTTTAETTETTGLTAFSSNGYTVGALAQLNTNTATYVDWSWKEGVTPGVDIVTYVGNGTNRTISHNLGAVPKLIIVRSREATSTGRWLVQHGAYGSARYAYLNEIFAFDTAGANLRWNSTDPTSSVFSLGTSSDGNHTGDNYIAYLFAEIPGFSAFGSYVGNGAADGPFVWCGFRPRFLLIKSGSTASTNWIIADTARDTFNVSTLELDPNAATAEQNGVSGFAIDVLSNGFKLRGTRGDINNSGSTFVFAAFADAPFKYARAR
jgi:hypothetical protein